MSTLTGFSSKIKNGQCARFLLEFFLNIDAKSLMLKLSCCF